MNVMFEARIGPQVRGERAGTRLVEVAGGDQVVAARADVGDFDSASAAQLPLHAHAPMFEPSGLEVLLIARCGRRERERVGLRKRVLERYGRNRGILAEMQGVETEVEIRRVEVKSLAGRQRALVVVKAVAVAVGRKAWFESHNYGCGLGIVNNRALTAQQGAGALRPHWRRKPGLTRFARSTVDVCLVSC